MFAHVPIVIGIQILYWILGKILGVSAKASAWMGCFASAAICIMREITQREYQWIEQFGHGHRANMPGYAGLQVWEWNAHSISETIVAIAVSLMIAITVSMRST